MPDHAPNWSVNPFALAELLIGEDMFDGKDPGRAQASWTRVQEVLGEAFNIKENVKVIFEADGGEPPRLALFQDIANFVRVPQRLAEILQLDVVRKAIGKLGPDGEKKMRRVLPYLVPVAGASFGPPGAQPADGADNAESVASCRPPAVSEIAPAVAVSKHTLAQPLASFMGHRSERAEVTRLLAEYRLSTRQGCGGIGRTGVALELGWVVLEVLPDGYRLVGFAPLTDAGTLAQAVGTALDFAGAAGKPLPMITVGETSRGND